MDILVLFHLIAGNSTDTRGPEIGLFCLDATGAAKLLIALLLPLGNQHGICVSVLEEVVVELPADGLLLIIQVVDVP